MKRRTNFSRKFTDIRYLLTKSLRTTEVDGVLNIEKGDEKQKVGKRDLQFQLNHVK